MYANGKKMFGDKLYSEFDVEEGIYNVMIRLDNGDTFTDKIIVREDPIEINDLNQIKLFLNHEKKL